MLEFNILNNNLERIGIIDQYVECIWTDRFWQCGDFEIYMAATEKNFALFDHNYGEEDCFITRDDTETVMVVENVNTVNSVDGGDNLIISGRSLSSILDRRIVWDQTSLNGTIDDCVHTLISENFMLSGNRQIPRMVMDRSSVFVEKYSMQATGDNVLDVIIELCQKEKCGFKIIIDGGKFRLVLYKGENRSESQTKNPHIVFSPEFDNLFNDKYEIDKTAFKNVALVAGEGEGDARITSAVNTDVFVGMARRELYVDARDISSNDESISSSDYLLLLNKRGAEKLAEVPIKESVDGELESSRLYRFNRDFYLGDVVQAINRFGKSAESRILETIENSSAAGNKIIPTFSSWEA